MNGVERVLQPQTADTVLVSVLAGHPVGARLAVFLQHRGLVSLTTLVPALPRHHRFSVPQAAVSRTGLLGGKLTWGLLSQEPS